MLNTFGAFVHPNWPVVRSGARILIEPPSTRGMCTRINTLIYIAIKATLVRPEFVHVSVCVCVRPNSTPSMPDANNVRFNVCTSEMMLGINAGLCFWSGCGRLFVCLGVNFQKKKFMSVFCQYCERLSV